MTLDELRHREIAVGDEAGGDFVGVDPALGWPRPTVVSRKDDPVPPFVLGVSEALGLSVL